MTEGETLLLTELAKARTELLQARKNVTKQRNRAETWRLRWARDYSRTGNRTYICGQCHERIVP